MTEAAQPAAEEDQKPKTLPAKEFAAQSAASGLAPLNLQRRQPRAQDGWRSE